MTDFLSLATPIPEIQDTVPRRDIRKEGDFYLDKAEIIAYNGKRYGIELVKVEISVHEDLFNSTMAGSLHFQDSSDLAQLLPLIGEEKLSLVFTRPSESGRGLLDDKFEMEFRIYKMDHRRPDGERFDIQNYTLYFVSSEKIVDVKTKVWQTYVDMPYSDMVDKIFKEYIKSAKPINIEKTLYEHKFAASGLSPFQIITILSSKSISDEGNGSSYVFYEDMEKFNFVTIGKLMKQEPVQRYISQLSNVLEDGGNVKRRDRTIEDDIRRVENYTTPGGFSILNNMEGGMYAQQLIAVDILRKIWTKTDWDYKKEFDGLPHLYDSDVCTDALDALGSPPTVMKLQNTTKDHDKIPWLVAREPGIKPNHIEEYMLKRASQLQQSNGHRVHVNVSGDPRRRVGQVVEFLFPNHYGAVSENHKPDPPFDRYLGGKFLVTAMKHRIESHKYYCEMELMKDTFAQDIEHVDPIEFQKWTW